MSPFDQTRYQALVDGLEVSEIQFSALENQRTLGAEYYGPEFLAPYKRLLASKLWRTSLAECCSLITDGDHGSAEYADEGVPFVLSEAVEEGVINLDACRFITKRHAESLRRSMLREGDVLVTKTGAYFGKSAVVRSDLAGANTIAHVGILRPREYLDPFYLSTFLNSRYGYSQLRRRGIKATRPEIKLLEFREIVVPVASTEFMARVRRAVEAALARWREVEQWQANSQRLIEDALGLSNWKAPNPISYLRKASEVFRVGRLDSEYFEPFYSTLRKHIRDRGGVSLGNVLTEKVRRGISPLYVDDGDLPVINSQHVGKTHLVLEGNRRTSRALVENQGSTARTGIVKQWDVLLNSTGRVTIGRCQCVVDDVTAVVDNHVAILRPNQRVDPVFLSVFLNSWIGLAQTEQCHSGSPAK